MNRSDLDLRMRLSAFDWLARQVDQQGDVLDRDFLQQGFPFEGRQVPLVAPQGIFKPRELGLPLTITTTPNGPYQDHFGQDGLLNYRYRGTNPEHPDNVGLRRAMAAERPLIYYSRHRSRPLSGSLAGLYRWRFPAGAILQGGGRLPGKCIGARRCPGAGC